ncbi:MAG: acetyltransferase [Actinomycetia bacterium]|jgi:RimJ/RimL family protein N-acetyltransferase|nr:acetyltransferase [Actinomycetes bacterium]
MTVTLLVDATASAPALFLRPWGEGDAASLLEVHRDPVLRRWATMPVQSDEDAARWLEAQRRGWATGNRLSFAVLELQSGSAGNLLVANVVLKRGDPAEPSGEVGYWTAAHARGRGVAPRALEALTVWAFETFAADGLRRLELLHQIDNQGSCRVAQKCRYEFDKILPARPPFPTEGHLHIRQSDRA